jgi:hypothetical protein
MQMMLFLKGFRQRNGMMEGILEYWNIGILGLNTSRNFFTHISIIPPFHCSNSTGKPLPAARELHIWTWRIVLE